MPKIPVGAPIEQYIAEGLLKIGKGLFGVSKKPFSKEFWANSQKIGTTSAVSGRKMKEGIKLEDTPGYKSGDKIVGSRSSKNPDGTEKDITHYIRSKDGSMKAINIENGKAVASGLNSNNAKAMFESGVKSGNAQKAPWHYSSQALTKKAYAAGLGTLGAIGYGVNGLLSSDNEPEPAKANNAQTRTPEQEEKLKEIRERRAREADPERDLPSYARSGKEQADPIQTPQAKTNVKPKKSSGLNYDPIAEWAKTDQATNDKWNKRRENYTKMVGEGVDPYEAYDRSMQEQPAEPASTANASKPAQKAIRPTYTPMSTDQAVDAYRKQRYKNY